MTAPRQDAFLAGLGERLEDLSGVSGAQPWNPSGPRLTRRALALWQGAGRTRVRTESLAHGDRTRWDALCEAGLAAPDGSVTRFGAELGDLLSSHDLQVRVEATDGHLAHSFVAYCRGDRAVVLATEAPGGRDRDAVPSVREVADVASALTLDVVHRSWLPVALASWIGLAPAWSLATLPAEVPQELLQRRMDDPTVPPPADANAHLREVWSQPWVIWTMTTNPAQGGAAMIRAGARGMFGLERDPQGGPTRLYAVPAAAAWLGLVKVVEGRAV